MRWVRGVSSLLLFGAAVWTGVLVHDANTALIAGAQTGSFPVEVVGPDGVIYNGTVAVENATAYRVLAAAAEDGNFTLRVTGSGADLFVEAIAGYGNQGASGWCYDVWDGGWTRPVRSAGVQPLADGQASRWTFEEEGCGPLS